MTWTADLAIPSTATWARPAPVELVPLRYGRTAGRLLPFDAERRTWVWAGHASAGVTSITRDDEAITGWTWRNGTGPAGEALTFVDFGQRVETDGDLMAEGVGALDLRTGAVLELAADVMVDVLSRWSRVPVSRAQWRAFRAQCVALGLMVSGSIDRAISAQRAISEIAASVGASFAQGARSPVMVWPVDSVSGVARAVVERESVLSAVCDVEQLYTVARARFGPDASGELAQSCEVDAPRAVQRYGRRVLELSLPWVSDLRVALGVCQRRLRFVARPAWQVKAKLVGETAMPLGIDVRPGDVARVRWHVAAVDALTMVEAAVEDIESNEREIDARVPVGPAPRVRLVHPRQALPIEPPPNPGALPECAIVTDADEPVLMDSDAYAVADCGPPDP
jgi:hypothetical protein